MQPAYTYINSKAPDTFSLKETDMKQ